MSDFIIQGTTLTSIANGVRNLTGETGQLSPAQMAGKISGIEKYQWDIIGPPIAPSWSTGDINEIKECLDAYYAGEEVDFSAWNIGDTRTFGSVELRLVHKFTDADIMTARTDAQADGSAAPNKHPYTIGSTDKLPAYAVMVTSQTGNSKWMTKYSDPQKYFSSVLDSTLTSQYSSLNNDLKSILKQFQCYVLNEGQNSGKTGYYQELRYIAAPACKEVGSSNSYGNEGNYQITFDYFKSDAATRRKITGSRSDWWLRSTADGDDDEGDYYSYLVIAASGYVDTFGVNGDYGTVWFGCI